MGAQAQSPSGADSSVKKGGGGTPTAGAPLNLRSGSRGFALRQVGPPGPEALRGALSACASCRAPPPGCCGGPRSESVRVSPRWKLNPESCIGICEIWEPLPHPALRRPLPAAASRATAVPAALGASPWHPGPPPPSSRSSPPLRSAPPPAPPSHPSRPTGAARRRRLGGRARAEWGLQLRQRRRRPGRGRVARAPPPCRSAWAWPLCRAW